MKLDIGEVVGFGDAVGFHAEDEMCVDGREGGLAEGLHSGAPVGGAATDAHRAMEACRAAEAGGGPRRFRSLMLGWTDPDSGDRLTARIRGGAELVHELEGLGFEVLEDGQAEAGGSAGDSGNARRVSVVTDLTRASRPGAPRR